LRIDIDKTKQSIEDAHADAFALSLTIVYPTSQNIQMLVQVAHHEAYALAINAVIPAKETIRDLIRKAHVEMLSLSSRLPTLEEKVVSAEEAEKS
ncbi:MAG: hypothetical protein OEZ21_10160, partial [Candidatus Bathyarchaeota archaeon]|nr:hypothetical protein [Candidatus Bathyarchaeota archaeon]